jgi:predicted DNA-binding transcriptional regulator AlpA
MHRKDSSHFEFKRRFISEIELEQITGISRRTWQKHRLGNRGPRYYKIHGAIRYHFDEVLTWITDFSVPVGGRRDQ